MKVTPNIVRHEFIGAEAKIAESRHSGYERISGKVIDETRNTFTILTKGKRKSIEKESALFHFKFDGGTTVEIDGKLLVGRPEDRLKKSIRRLW